MNNPRDPRNIERIIQQAHGNARAPVTLKGNNPSQDEFLRPDISRIIWPDERDDEGKPLTLRDGNKRKEMAQYGYDHGAQTAQLAVVIAKHLGVSSATELKIVEGAARFHDLGRSRPWQYRESHNQLSAIRAAEVMHNDPGLWASGEVRDGIGRLIMQHGLDGAPPSLGDKMRVALWDADCFESVRLAPGTREGVVIMNERMALCVTPWAKKEENQRKWRDHRGGW